jgi:benzoyl-CoA reductase subunit C
VVGSFCEQPPWGLLRTLEQSGCDIVDDDFQLGLRALRGAISCDGVEPLDALVGAFLKQGTATACRYVGNAVKGAELLTQIRTARADGVVFLAASFCDPALLDQPMLERALDDAGVPHTSVKFAENTGQFQPVREQAGAFGDSLKLWGAQ